MGDLEPIYCAEQIKVPPALPEILKAWTKQVIREGVPQEKLNSWSVMYFAKLKEEHERKKAAAAVQPSGSAEEEKTQ